MRRSKWKAPFLKLNFVKKLNVASRSSKILPKFLGSSYYVHNGRNYDEIVVTKDMLGHKFGEFSLTRKGFLFKKKKRKK